MTSEEIMTKMIGISNGNIHDIDHFIRVWTYAKIIGKMEKLDAETQYILEVAAIVHDIACPLCRVKYGNTNGEHQEKEGAFMVKGFLENSGMNKEEIDQVSYLVSHHHTFADIKGIDYQILVEADYIANASENGYKKDNIKNALSKIIKTKSAIKLIESIFCL